ncbi:MAG: hypothetical protein AB1805_16185 [Nitrospirota bacterium]
MRQKGNLKRRHYFINKELQGKYTFYFFLMVTLGSIAFTVIFSLLASDSLTIVYENYDIRLGKTPAMLITEILKAHWIFILASGIIVSVLSIFLTHRFAGPIYRFERSVDEMIRGDVSFDIRLRKHDSGKELAALMNLFTLTLSSKINEMRRLVESADRHIEETLAKLPSGSGRAGDALTRVKELNARLRTVLYSYRTKETPASPDPPLRVKADTDTLQETLHAVDKIREFNERLEELMSSTMINNEMACIAGSIESYLAQFSADLPGRSREALTETLEVLNQIRELSTKLDTIIRNDRERRS